MSQSKLKLQVARDLRNATQLATRDSEIIRKVEAAVRDLDSLTKDFDWDTLDTLNLPVDVQLELEQRADQVPEIPTPKKRHKMARI